MTHLNLQMGLLFRMLQTACVWNGRSENEYESEQLTEKRNEVLSVCLGSVPQATEGGDNRLESGSKASAISRSQTTDKLVHF